MALLGIMAGSILLVIGSLVLAVVTVTLAWWAFRAIRHPEWSAIVPLLLFVCLVVGLLPRGPLLPMVAAFASVAIVPLWIEGRAWRGRL